MKKTAYFIALLAIVALFAPIHQVSAQSCCSYFGDANNDAFSYYQYPIPLYTYFETPNSTARNYYPTNYHPNSSQYSYNQPAQYGYGFQPSYNTGYGSQGQGSNCGYYCGQSNNQPYYSNNYQPRQPQYSSKPQYRTGGPRNSSVTSNPNFYLTGSGDSTFSYVADNDGSNW